MRPNCECGRRAGYWYGPLIYRKLNFTEYLNNHAYWNEQVQQTKGSGCTP